MTPEHNQYPSLLFDEMTDPNNMDTVNNPEARVDLECFSPTAPGQRADRSVNESRPLL